MDDRYHIELIIFMISKKILFNIVRSPFLLITGDILFYIGSLFATIGIRYGSNFWQEILIHILPFSILIIFWIIIFYINNLYEITFTKNWISIIRKIVSASIIALVVSVFIFYLSGNIFAVTPKTNLFIFSSIFCFLTIIFRLFIITRQYKSPQTLILIGESIEIIELKNFLQNQYKKIIHIPKFDFEKINEIFTKNNIESMIIDEKEKNFFQEFNTTLEILSKSIQIISTHKAYEEVFKKIPLNEIGNIWFLEYIDIKKDLFDNIKRLIDIIGSIVLIIIFSPLLLFSACGVLLSSPGPIFYKQKRVGKNGKNFILYKFRSMYHSTEKNPDAFDANPIWTKENDPRITRFGKLLRSSHFDEFPQLFIILIGKMSFVGPRPERPFFIEDLSKKIPYFKIRQMIKPGLTGWAQIHYRYTSNTTEFFEKFQYDLYYFKNRSLILDILIILKTLRTIII